MRAMLADAVRDALTRSEDALRSQVRAPGIAELPLADAVVTVQPDGIRLLAYVDVREFHFSICGLVVG